MVKFDKSNLHAKYFDAMKIFLEDYWERGDRLSDDFAKILSSLESEKNGEPRDIALWNDWIEAVRKSGLEA